MKVQGKLIAGVVAGAGAMYLLDPDCGARRRSLLRDRGLEVGNRTREAAAELGARFRPDRGNEAPLPDGVSLHSPATTRLVLGAVGGLLVLKGLRGRGAARRALTMTGVGLLSRAAGNIEPRRLVRLAVGRPAIRVEKTITVPAPLPDVWELWSNFENFPRFMTHLREVRKVDEGHSHWVAAGPAGVPVEWDAIITDWVPEQFIGWRSVAGSTVDTTGQVRFRRLSDAETQIDVGLSYRPPAGAAGHAVAALFGTDPKSAMDEDLTRFKSLLENGTARSDDTPIHLEEVTSKARPRRKRSSARKKS